MQVGTRVKYKTPRGGAAGTGEITGIRTTGRGLWYVVVDAVTRVIVQLRAANIQVLAR